MNTHEFMAELYKGVPPEKVTYLYTLPKKQCLAYPIGQIDQMLTKADALSAAETEMQNFVGNSAEEIMTVVPNTILIPENADLKKAVFAAIGADKEIGSIETGKLADFVVCDSNYNLLQVYRGGKKI